MNFVLPAHREANAADDQQSAENIQHPMKAGDQSHARANEHAAQEQRANHPPKQNAMLLLFGHREKVEDDQEDEEIVGAQGNFQNVAGDKLERDLVPLPEIEHNCECGGENNVDRAPGQGHAKADGPSAAMQAQVQHQHRQREHVEEDPEIEQGSLRN